MLNSIDETSPLEALVAQSDLTATPLNDTIKKFTNAISQNDTSNSSSKAKLLKDESDSSATLDPVIVRDKDPNDITTNITLGFRQPSFSSLSDVITTKDGKVVDGSSNNLNSINEEDPVIVFDTVAKLSSLNNEIADAPIGLTVRQPSYVSLGQEIIPKGTTSLAEFQPIIEEVVPNQGEPMEENADDDDDLPQVHLIKDLKSKNLKRWREIGYEPPEDLIPLVRAASQSGMMIGTQLSSFPVNQLYSSNSQNNIYVNGSSNRINGSNNIANNGQMLGTINEDNENENLNYSNSSAAKRMRRSSSFGMKVGELTNASDIINEILGVSHNLNEIQVEEEEEENDEQFQKQIEEQLEGQLEEQPESQAIQLQEQPQNEKLFNQNDEELVLFGHLSQIDTELTGPPVFRVLATGEVDLQEDIEQIKSRLKSIVEICTKHLWIEETLYVKELLNLINQSLYKNPKSNRATLGFVHDDPNAIIEELKEKLEKIDADADEKIRIEEQRKENILKEIDDKYMREANQLDEKFQNPENLNKLVKPSKDLMNLRNSAKKLLKQNRIAEIPRITNRIQQLEIEEQRKANEFIKEKYYSEDRALKEKTVASRKAVIQRYEYKLKRIEAERLAKVKAIKNRIQNLENEIQEEEDIRKWRLKNMNNNNYSSTSNNNSYAEQERNYESDFTETGALTLTPPKKLRRDFDPAILDEMTKEMMEKGSKANEININTVMKKTQKRNSTTRRRPTRSSSCRREKKTKLID